MRSNGEGSTVEDYYEQGEGFGVGKFLVDNIMSYTLAILDDIDEEGESLQD